MMHGMTSWKRNQPWTGLVCMIWLEHEGKSDMSSADRVLQHLQHLLDRALLAWILFMSHTFE